MTKYCLGFMFNENETDVLLIEKQKPSWQRGKFNGIGGKVEEGETSMMAMCREFNEETGIDNSLWDYVVSIYGEDWHVDVFTIKDDVVFNFEQKESERLALIPIKDLDDFNVIHNLYWLIPLCLEMNIDYSISNNKLSILAK
jgi:8-oxo-dGTP diphosphatase